MRETRHVIPEINSHTALSDAIRLAHAGDTIACRTEAMKEMGERAHARMCPDKRLEFEVTDAPNPKR